MRIFITALLLLGSICWVQAQKFVYIDSEYILSRLPEYEDAQEELNALADQWNSEIEAKLAAVDQMYQQFQAEQVLLTDQMKQERIAQIEAAEADIADFQRQKFGPEGELFQKRKELIKPIQDLMYEEIQKMATLKDYDFVFDKAQGNYMLFYSDRYDKSNDILREMKNAE